MDKGKGPMEDVPRASVAQQVKTLIHTSQQFKKKLTQMTSVLDTHEVATTQVVDDKQVNTTVTSTCDDQVMPGLKLLICHSGLGTENTVSQRIQTNMHKIGKWCRN